jgi:hypothetical protein
MNVFAKSFKSANLQKVDVFFCFFLLLLLNVKQHIGNAANV